MSSTLAQGTILKVLMFPVGKLYLALQVELVQKVIPAPEVINSDQKLLGIAIIDDRTAIILDLYQKLYGYANPQLSSYIVLLKTFQQDYYGISISEIPTLMELHPSIMRLLPPAYRSEDSLGIASHVALVSYKEKNQTVFLLDPQAIFYMFQVGEQS